MSSRTQAADHYDEIAKRLTEIQAERMRAIAGCVCPVDMLDHKQHAHNCPLAPQLSDVHIGRAVAITNDATRLTLEKLKNWAAHRRAGLP
jgi:hypothetical protein